MTEKIQLAHKKPESLTTDVLVLVLPADQPTTDGHFVDVDAVLAGSLKKYVAELAQPLEPGTVVSLPTLGRLGARQLVISVTRSGDAEDAAARTTEAVAMGVREGLNSKPTQLAVSLPLGVEVRAAALGARLGGYRFDRYLREKSTLKGITLLLGRSVTPADRQALAVGLKVGAGVCLARDLVNEPPNILYPESFAKEAQRVAKQNKLSIKVLDAKGISRAKMYLHEAVGKGSSRPPTFIHLTYTPKNSKGSIAFVGKGLTFDSGGLCIKPMAGMAEMKSDMAGGAAVLGMMEAIVALQPSVTVHGIIGCAENMPDGNAYRPADIIPSMCGKTVEIINTDAEGRLVLADALYYATQLKPDFIVDAATLTGATLVSLGPPYSAFFTGQDEIAEAMQGAAQRAGESFWRMPLIEELRSQLKSDVADLKHTGDRFGGAITAALFLREFTDGVPWMHCDIPGAVLRDRPSGMHPKGGTGHAVLTFLELVSRHDRYPIIGPGPGTKRARTSPPRGRRSVRSAARGKAVPAPRRRKTKTPPRA